MEIFQDENIKKIIEKLKNAIKLTHFEGHVYVCGGAVRDALLKRPIHDLDIVVAAKEGGIIVANIFAAREKCYLLNTNPVVFPSYGTAKVSLFKDPDLRDINIEFVESRKCSYEVTKDCFGTIEQDSKRRDLTINSLYWNINDGKIYDYNGGVNDLIGQTLRTVNPDVNFNESPIRMLRTTRFSAELGWGIEKETWLSIIKNAHLIKKSPQELITSEFSKILTSRNASIGVRKLMYCGLLHRIVPDIYDLTSVFESYNDGITVFDHTMKVLDAVQPVIESRLAALFHDIGAVVTEGYSRTLMSKDMFSAEVAASDLKDMRYSNSVITAVETAIRYHNVFNNYADGVIPPDRKIRRFVNLVGEHIGTTIDLLNANNLHRTYSKKKSQALDILNRIEELDKIEEVKNVKLPIDGKELIKELGMKRGGPIIGKILEVLKEAYFENPKITKEECIEIAKKEVKVLAV